MKNITKICICFAVFIIWGISILISVELYGYVSKSWGIILCSPGFVIGCYLIYLIAHDKDDFDDSPESDKDEIRIEGKTTFCYIKYLIVGGLIGFTMSSFFVFMIYLKPVLVEGAPIIHLAELITWYIAPTSVFGCVVGWQFWRMSQRP